MLRLRLLFVYRAVIVEAEPNADCFPANAIAQEEPRLQSPGLVLRAEVRWLPRADLYIGLGLPSLITVATSTATAPQATAELLPKTTAVVAMSNRRFQTVSQNGRLKIVLPSEVGYSGAVVTFYGSGSPVTVPINAGSEINVPDQASEVIITTPIAQSDRIALNNVSANSLTVLRLAAQKDPLYGLRYAVGMHSKPFRLTVADQTTGRADILGNCLNNIV